MQIRDSHAAAFDSPSRSYYHIYQTTDPCAPPLHHRATLARRASNPPPSMKLQAVPDTISRYADRAVMVRTPLLFYIVSALRLSLRAILRNEGNPNSRELNKYLSFFPLSRKPLEFVACPLTINHSIPLELAEFLEHTKCHVSIKRLSRDLSKLNEGSFQPS